MLVSFIEFFYRCVYVSASYARSLARFGSCIFGLLLLFSLFMYMLFMLWYFLFMVNVIWLCVFCFGVMSLFVVFNCG